MQFLRTLGLLLLFVMSNAGIASACNIPLPHLEEDQVEYQFTENQNNLSESILITPAEVLTNRTFFPVALVPEHFCTHKVSKASRYLVYSRTIVPSLDIADIIFPFHSFL